MEEVRLKSSCCSAEVDFSGGGYDGEDIVPIVEYCKKCGGRCEVKRIVPKGYKEEIMPF